MDVSEGRKKAGVNEIIYRNIHNGISVILK